MFKARVLRMISDFIQETENGFRAKDWNAKDHRVLLS